MITTQTCNPMTDNQKWRWTQHNQLQSIFNQACLGAPESPANFNRVKLFACDPNKKYQVWVCVDDFVRLNGTILNLNYGNVNDTVVLYDGTGRWSEWKVFGEDLLVCDKRP
jgi:C-type mannose receptor